MRFSYLVADYPEIKELDVLVFFDECSDGFYGFLVFSFAEVRDAFNESCHRLFTVNLNQESSFNHLGTSYGISRPVGYKR